MLRSEEVSRGIFLFVLLLLAVGHSVAGTAADWPQLLGPDRNGVVAEDQWRGDWPPEGLPVLWTRCVGYAASQREWTGTRPDLL